MKEKLINWLIKVLKVDTNKISDGYHTFEQLYEHRIELWIAYCDLVERYKNADPKNSHWKNIGSWISKKHSDGSVWDGWFILGLGKEEGKQMTYHLPIKYFQKIRYAELLNKAPKYDGHTPEDVIKRLKTL